MRAVRTWTRIGLAQLIAGLTTAFALDYADRQIAREAFGAFA
jgi:hypothetical protein